MKKNNFVTGALAATIGIVVCKILGLVYVIPFYKIIGTQGGALYSYAYSIYSVFLNLSTASIPTAISKISSECNALNKKGMQNKAFKVASNLLNIIGIIAFGILFIFSDYFATSIIGNAEGGNSVSDVSISIKVVSLALLVVPKLSTLRGYFQGNEYITQSSLSNVIEQLVRVITIILGSYISVKVFKLPINSAVYVSIFAATLGALISYLYLKIKFKKHKSDFISSNNTEVTDVSNKFLIKKIIFYALPFILINLLQSAYNVVDTFTVVKTMTAVGYPTSIAETTIGVLNTWGSKLNMIVVSISLGLIVSLIPNITSSYAKKDFKDINNKINQSVNILLFTTLPMAIGMSLLAAPVWNIFYGYDKLSVSIFAIFILQVVIYSLYITIINAVQSMNQTKTSLGVLLLDLLLKVALNSPVMKLFAYLNIESYYGPIIVNATIEFLSFLLILLILKKKYQFKYKNILTTFSKIIVCLLLMIVVLLGLKQIYFSFAGIVSSIITIILYSSIGSIIYFLCAYKFKLIDDLFGSEFISRLLFRLKFKNKNKKITRKLKED